MCGSGGKVVIRAEAGVPGAEQGQSSEGLEGDVPGLVPPSSATSIKGAPSGEGDKVTVGQRL